MTRSQRSQQSQRNLARATATLALLGAVVLSAQSAGGSNGAGGGTDELPPGVEQLLPRGKIAAIFEPELVPAAAADIPADAWVLGVSIDGEAHAYSLNLLNSHEVVNDRIGETPYAAVW